MVSQSLHLSMPSLSMTLLIAAFAVGCASNGGHRTTDLSESAPPRGSMAADGQRPLLLNITAGFEDPHKVTMALQLAGHGLDSGRPVHLFFNVRGVAVVAEAKVPGAAFNDKPIDQLLADAVDRGAKVWVCPHCAKAMGVERDGLIEGARFATAERLFNVIDEDAAVFSY